MILPWAFLSESSDRLLTFYRWSSQVQSSCRTSLHRRKVCSRIALLDLWQVCILSNYSFNLMLSSSNFSQGAERTRGWLSVCAATSCFVADMTKCSIHCIRRPAINVAGQTRKLAGRDMRKVLARCPLVTVRQYVSWKRSFKKGRNTWRQPGKQHVRSRKASAVGVRKRTWKRSSLIAKLGNLF